MAIVAELHLEALDLGSQLQAIADLLVMENLRWIASQRQAGLDPPCCVFCAGPPWTAGVDYVTAHGESVGIRRQYLTAPVMFAAQEGTCIDIASYDAAAHMSKGRRARAVVVPAEAENLFHCVVEVDGTTYDPTDSWTRSTECVCGGAA